MFQIKRFFRPILSTSHKMQHRKQTMIVQILAVQPCSSQAFINDAAAGFCLTLISDWFMFACFLRTPAIHHVCSWFFAILTLSYTDLVSAVAAFWTVSLWCIGFLFVCFIPSRRMTRQGRSGKRAVISLKAVNMHQRSFHLAITASSRCTSGQTAAHAKT